MSYGQLSVLLLTYIITDSDHRLCAVEDWVKAHQQILELSTGWSIGEKDTSDDQLARVVRGKAGNRNKVGTAPDLGFPFDEVVLKE